MDDRPRSERGVWHVPETRERSAHHKVMTMERSIPSSSDSLILPLHGFIDGGTSILLHRGEATVDVGNRTLTGPVEVRLDLAPRSGIFMYAKFNTSFAEAFHWLSNDISAFAVDCAQIPGFAVRLHSPSESELLEVKWCPESDPVPSEHDNSVTMQRLLFHLLNCRNISGTRHSLETRDTTKQPINHIELSGGGWEIEIKSLFETEANLTLAREGGSQHLTHVAAIRKIDDQTFTAGEAKEVLTALRHFLSFARGSWCSPVCPVGFDTAGERVWAQWSSPDEWSDSQCNWFVYGDGRQLAVLFPFFMERWQDDCWREAFATAIYWYVVASASSRSIDAGLVLMQAAIERLACEYTVHERQLISEDGFKRLRASDRFRLLLSSLGVPLNVPQKATSLAEWVAGNSVCDGPHALTEIRNSLVHPNPGQRSSKLRGDTLTEAWNLGLWYLELSILAICGFNGEHWDRNTRTTASVPWTATAT